MQRAWALALALCPGSLSAQISVDVRAPSAGPVPQVLGVAPSFYQRPLATLEFPLNGGLSWSRGAALSFPGRQAPAASAVSAFAHEARAQGAFEAESAIQAQALPAAPLAARTARAARRMLAPVRGLLAQAAPALKAMPIGALYGFGSDLSETLQGGRPSAARPELPVPVDSGLLQGSFRSARSAQILRLPRSEEVSASGRRPPGPGFSPTLGKILKAASAAAALDSVTKLLAHGLARLHWISPPDSHEILNLAAWRLNSVALPALLATSLLIPWMILNLARIWDIGGAHYAGLKKVTGFFPWLVGLIAGGLLANTLEGAAFGAVTNPFSFGELSFNLADHALFMGMTLMVQLSFYSYRFYSWVKEGAKAPHPFSRAAIAAASLGSVFVSYSLGPLISNQEFFRSMSAWQFFLQSPELLVQMACAALISWIPGYLIYKRARHWIGHADPSYKI